ncbi:hypothetical protein VCSRO187_0842 [Vibrio cholerae]|nr:hypothetical protein VCSRO187_0842 [Vibrio cholerae]
MSKTLTEIAKAVMRKYRTTVNGDNNRTKHNNYAFNQQGGANA